MFCLPELIFYYMNIVLSLLLYLVVVGFFCYMNIVFFLLFHSHLPQKSCHPWFVQDCLGDSVTLCIRCNPSLALLHLSTNAGHRYAKSTNKVYHNSHCIALKPTLGDHSWSHAFLSISLFSRRLLAIFEEKPCKPWR
jgi:hypothetical protein